MSSIEICDALDAGPTERYLARLRVLRDIDRAILAAQSPRETAEVALVGLRTLASQRWAAVIRFDHEAKEARILAAWGPGVQPAADATAPLHSAPFLSDAARGQPYILKGLSDPALSHPWLHLLRLNDVRNYVSVPLVARQEVIGALALGTDAPGFASVYMLEIMGDIADSLAVAMQQARLYAQVCRHAQELEERVAARTAALVQAERLAITGRLGASLAHEINNPLQSIIGCLGLAEEALAEPADGAGDDHLVARHQQVARYLQVARTELRSVARTVAQLRDLQGMSSTEHSEPMDINEMLSQLLTLNARRLADQRIEVIFEAASRLPAVPVEADAVRQVFLNVLLNALDAMSDGGALHVRTAATRRPAGVRVIISDTGHGMSAEVLAQVFQPFYTTKQKGLGLGLFTSRSIMERHGGSIDLRSREGQGTSFILWLPVHARAAAKEARRDDA